MRNIHSGQAEVDSTPLFVTVLAQDHCYSDLLRFVRQRILFFVLR